MIARYLLFRELLGFSHAQAKALASAGYFVVGWVEWPS